MQTSCLDCGTLIPLGSRKGRCPTCRTRREARYEFNRARESHRKNRGYNSPGWQEARRVALNRAGHTCQTCGTQLDLTVHHIDHDRGNNAQSNLIVLCRADHARLEARERRAKRNFEDDRVL